MTGLALMLAVSGACCYSVAAWLQQAAVGVATGGGGLRLAGWARMVRTPRWVGGLALSAAGAGLHAGALSLAPLVVVQPVGALSIALTTVLSTRSAGRRLTRSTALAVAACVGGVGVFVVVAARSAPPVILPAGVETRAVVLAGLIVAALAVVGVVAGRRGRCLAFAAAAGVDYGLVSVLVHTTAGRVEAGGIGQVEVGSVVVAVAALLVGGWFVQHAYAAGPPQVVVASQTVIDPMMAIGIGIGLLGEGARIVAPAAAGLAACAVVAITGVIALARRHPVPPVDADALTGRRRPVPMRPASTVNGADRRLRI